MILHSTVAERLDNKLGHEHIHAALVLPVNFISVLIVDTKRHSMHEYYYGVLSHPGCNFVATCNA